MSSVAGWVLGGALLVWFIFALRTGNVPSDLWTWLKKPENEAQTLRILTWVVAIIFAGATWVSDADSELDNFRTEATGIAIAVVFIEEVSRRRAYLERKQEIILQLASRSNAFALDAAYIARNEKWLVDGSLEGAYLAGANLQGAHLAGANLQSAYLARANLQGAYLWGANLQGAHLAEANLQGASLWGANLQDVVLLEAKYTSRKNDTGTIWPDGFDPIAAGAILVEDEGLSAWPNALTSQTEGQQRQPLERRT